MNMKVPKNIFKSLKSHIVIPEGVLLEWENKVWNEKAANTWWTSLTDEQRIILGEAGANFFGKKYVQEAHSRGEHWIQDLIRRSEDNKYLVLSKDENLNRFTLSGRIEKSFYGVRGKCCSQPLNFIPAVITGELGIYSNNSCEHQKGQKTVNLVFFALGVIPGITIAQTPWNSIADVGLKWDLLVIWNENVFPIQVKSSSQGIEDALEEGSRSNYAENSMDDLMEKISELHDTKQRKILQEQLGFYRGSAPLYIWASHQVKTICSLVELFSNAFGIESNLELCKEQAVEAYLAKYPDRCQQSEWQRLKQRFRISTVSRCRRERRCNRSMINSFTSLQDTAQPE